MAHGPAGGGTAPGSEGRAGREETRAKASQRRANPGKEEPSGRRTTRKAVLGRKSFSLREGIAMENDFKSLVALENKVNK